MPPRSVGPLVTVLATAVAFAAACSEGTSTQAPPASVRSVAPAATSAPRELRPAGTALADVRVREILELTLDPNVDSGRLRAALDDIAKSVDKVRKAGRKAVLLRLEDGKGDLRFVAVLIELIDAATARRAAFHSSVVEAL